MGGVSDDSSADALSGDQFGHSVHIDENRMIVGAPKTDSTPFTNVGAAYIYEFVGDQWVQKSKLMPPTPFTSSIHYGHSVLVSGDMAIVGGQSSDTLYVYFLVDGEWLMTQTLSHPHQNQYYHSIVYEDDVLAINWLENNVTRFLTIYERVGSRFELAATFGDGLPMMMASKPALHGGRIVMGAVQAGNGNGGAYVFEKINGQWSQSTTLIPVADSATRAIGKSAALNNGFIVVGADTDNVAGEFSGAAYIFELENDTWHYWRRLPPAFVAPGEWFAYALEMSGNTLLSFSRGQDGSDYKLRFFENIAVEVGDPLCLPNGDCLCTPDFSGADCRQE